MSVSIVRSNHQTVNEAVAEALKSIEYVPTKGRILIKPNVVGPMSVDSQVVTDIAVVDALVAYFRGFTDDICVAESSSVGYDTMESFRASGYMEWAEQNGVRLVDLRKEETREVPWKFGTIKIPRIVLESEFVNVPKMKTHNQTGITICMKNLKGVIRDEDKMMFHRKGLHDYIRALSQAAQPELNVVDAMNAMEGEGPGRSGSKKEMELILAGHDPAEVDRVCLEIMGFDLSDAIHVPDVRYETRGVPLNDVRTRFMRPTGHFQKLNSHVWMGNTCSGCVFQLADAMAGLKRRPLKALSVVVKNMTRPLHIVTGSDMELNIDGGKVVCIGSCSRKAAESLGVDYLRGCPPSSDDIIDEL